MALLGALCIWLNSLGFTNRSLRVQVSQLLGVPPEVYTRNHMSYDLARLRRKGLIERRPGTNTYDLTADGQRVALCYTKVHDRILGPPHRRRPTTSPTPAPPSTRHHRQLHQRQTRTRRSQESSLTLKTTAKH